MRIIEREPWHNDFPLTGRDVARIVATDLPALHPCTAVKLGEGWDFTTFCVNDRWVFRFPKRRPCARQLTREIGLLAALAPHLDATGVGFPRYCFEVVRPAAFPAGYAGYTRLPGRALCTLSATACDALAVARTLGAFLSTLHASAPVPRPRVYHDELPAMVADFRQALEIAAPALPVPVVQACRSLLADRVPPPYTGDPLYGHGDLGAEHVLVEGDVPPVLSIIDWGDAGWGNPLADFVGLWAWGGDAAAAAALDAAGQAAGDEDWERLRFWGACYAIGTVRYGYKDRQTALRRAGVEWLSRMQRNGQLADPGQPDA